MRTKSVATALAAGAILAPIAESATPRHKGCQNPTINAWVGGQYLNAVQGAWLSEPCHPGRKIRHRLVVIRHDATHVTLEMVPVR